MKKRLLDYFGWKSADSGGNSLPAAHLEVRLIANADLTPADIPADDAGWDWPGIPAFAASFSGYQYWGSSKKCFDVAKLAGAKRLHDLTLTELRTMLFCDYRSICHDGQLTADDLPRMRTIIGEIRKRVDERAFD